MKQEKEYQEEFQDVAAMASRVAAGSAECGRNIGIEETGEFLAATLDLIAYSLDVALFLAYDQKTEIRFPQRWNGANKKSA